MPAAAKRASLRASSAAQLLVLDFLTGELVVGAL